MSGLTISPIRSLRYQPVFGNREEQETSGVLQELMAAPIVPGNSAGAQNMLAYFNEGQLTRISPVPVALHPILFYTGLPPHIEICESTDPERSLETTITITRKPPHPKPCLVIIQVGPESRRVLYVTYSEQNAGRTINLGEPLQTLVERFIAKLDDVKRAVVPK